MESVLDEPLGNRSGFQDSLLLLCPGANPGGGGGTAWEVKVNRSEMQEVAKAVVKVGQSSVWSAGLSETPVCLKPQVADASHTKLHFRRNMTEQKPSS